MNEQSGGPARPESASEENRRILQKLKEAKAEYDKVKDGDRIPVSTPDKYAPPIGVDDDGKPFPVKP